LVIEILLTTSGCHAVVLHGSVTCGIVPSFLTVDATDWTSLADELQNTHVRSSCIYCTPDAFIHTLPATLTE